MPEPNALRRPHPIRPLPFDARKLEGISEKHSYQMDYGAAAAKYIDAFFRNVNWDEVNSRLERAEKTAAALSAR